jgi:hypothetical protein
MTENRIPKLPVPPASWKLDRARAGSTSQPESAAQAMQALDRLESEIAQAAADRGSWGAPEYVTVASIRVHPDRLPVDEDVVEGIVPTVVVGPFRCDLWPICRQSMPWSASLERLICMMGGCDSLEI